MSKIAYLACPYNHPDLAVRQKRYELANLAAAHLIQQRIFVFSPLTHNVTLFSFGLSQGWGFWKDYDLAFIAHFDSLIVLMLEGWEQSQGVRDEIEYAKKLKLPIEYLDPESIQVLKETLDKCFAEN